MLKRIFSLGIAVAVAIAAHSTGFAAVNIGDFDDGTTQGWEAQGAVTAITSTNFDSATHATTGSNSLNVFVPAGGQFIWGLRLDNDDIPTLAADLLANPILQADVSWTTSEWTTDPDGEWSRWDTISINSDVGWMQTNDSMMTDAANPAEPGTWNVTDFGASHQRTISWDLSSLIAGNEAGIAASSFFQINMSVNYDSNFDTGQGYSYWIDSIRLVPEPSSLALISLSGILALVRRHK